MLSTPTDSGISYRPLQVVNLELSFNDAVAIESTHIYDYGYTLPWLTFLVKHAKRNDAEIKRPRDGYAYLKAHALNWEELDAKSTTSEDAG